MFFIFKSRKLEIAKSALVLHQWCRNNLLTLCLDSHRALQNEGQREGVQASSSRTRDGEDNHGNVSGVKTGDVTVGQNSGPVIIIGSQSGSINL